MAIQGPTCGDKKKIDLSKMMDESSSEEHKENKVDSSSSSEDLTDDELKAIGDELEKVVTHEQKEHAMRILGAFRKGTSDSQKNSAMVSVIMRQTIKFDQFSNFIRLFRQNSYQFICIFSHFEYISFNFSWIYSCLQSCR